jgi:glucose-6-phosphate isomerase
MYLKIENQTNISETDFTKEIYDSIKKLNEENIAQRIWEKDYTVWRNDPTEISNRLGWLDCVDFVKERINEIEKFVDGIKDNFKHVLLLGMGGSSLAPEMFAEIFQSPEGYPDLHILDSTDPAAVNEKLNIFNPEETLYIVSTKSGGTV